MKNDQIFWNKEWRTLLKNLLAVGKGYNLNNQVKQNRWQSLKLVKWCMQVDHQLIIVCKETFITLDKWKSDTSCAQITNSVLNQVWHVRRIWWHGFSPSAVHAQKQNQCFRGTTNSSCVFTCVIVTGASPNTCANNSNSTSSIRRSCELRVKFLAKLHYEFRNYKIG